MWGMVNMLIILDCFFSRVIVNIAQDTNHVLIINYLKYIFENVPFIILEVRNLNTCLTMLKSRLLGRNLFTCFFSIC